MSLAHSSSQCHFVRYSRSRGMRVSHTRNRLDCFLRTRKSASGSRGKQDSTIEDWLGELRGGKVVFGPAEKRRNREKTCNKLILAPIRKPMNKRVPCSTKTAEQKREAARLSGGRPKKKKDIDNLREIVSSCARLLPTCPSFPSERPRSAVTCTCLPIPYRQNNLVARLTYGGVTTALPVLKPIYVDRRQDWKKAVVAIYFEGVLGDYYKRCLTDTSPNSIRLRKHASLGLQWLHQFFTLVFITSLSRSKALRILRHFQSAGISFQAAYRTHPTSVVDYSCLFVDLDVTLQQVLVVTSLDVGYEDLTEVGEECIYVKAGTKVRLMGNAMPVAAQNSPVTLLVPSLKSQQNTNLLPFDQVANCIHTIRKFGTWQTAFHCLLTHPPLNMCAISTTIVSEVVLDQTLGTPTADSIRKGSSGICELHKSAVFPESAPGFNSALIVLTQSPGQPSGCDVLESKALHVKSGFLNLMDFTTFVSVS